MLLHKGQDKYSHHKYRIKEMFTAQFVALKRMKNGIKTSMKSGRIRE